MKIKGVFFKEKLKKDSDEEEELNDAFGFAFKDKKFRRDTELVNVRESMRKKSEEKSSNWISRIQLGIIAFSLIIIPLEIVLRYLVFNLENDFIITL